MIEHEVLSSSSSSSGSATFLNPRLVNQKPSLSFAFSGMVHAKMVLKYLTEKPLGFATSFNFNTITGRNFVLAYILKQMVSQSAKIVNECVYMRRRVRIEAV